MVTWVKVVEEARSNLRRALKYLPSSVVKKEVVSVSVPLPSLPCRTMMLHKSGEMCIRCKDEALLVGGVVNNNDDSDEDEHDDDEEEDDDDDDDGLLIMIKGSIIFSVRRGVIEVRVAALASTSPSNKGANKVCSIRGPLVPAENATMPSASMSMVVKARGVQ